MMYDNIILSIDPATTNLGVSVIFIRGTDIVDIKTHEVIIPKYLSDNVISDPIHLKLELVERMVLHYCDVYQPTAFSIETPFIDRFRPTSAIPLSRTLQVITNAVRMFNPFIYINMISPFTVKSTIGANMRGKKGDNFKTSVTDAILLIPELQGYVDYRLISEHEVDAVVIGYNLLLQIRQQPMLLFT